MVTVIEPIAGCASRAYVRELENVAIDGAPGSEDVEACAQAVIPSLPAQGEALQPGAVANQGRIRLDTERLIKQARNKDEELAIIAAINRFYTIACLGATDRR